MLYATNRVIFQVILYRDSNQVINHIVKQHIKESIKQESKQEIKQESE